MDLGWAPSMLGTLVLSTVTGFLTYQRLRSHRHHVRTRTSFSVSSPASPTSSDSMVVGGSLFVLCLVGLLLLKSLGVFESAPFTMLNTGMSNPYVVACVIFCAATAPLLEDIRHRSMSK